MLPEPWEPGTPLADVIPLGEEVLEIELTRNRPDCLSVYGIAREVAALFPGAELRPPPGKEPERGGRRARGRDDRRPGGLSALHRPALPGRAR